MKAFVSRKRRRSSPSDEVSKIGSTSTALPVEDDSTDFKLAVLLSLHPNNTQEELLEALLNSEGSVEGASELLKLHLSSASASRKTATRTNGPGYQSSISSFAQGDAKNSSLGQSLRKTLTKKGKTLHLYTPEDIERHTPCSIIHNFLPTADADALLKELLKEAPTFTRDTFKLFDNVVQSPHTNCFYVDSWDEAERVKTEYVYNGSYIEDVRRTLPEMRKVSAIVRQAVNKEIERRIRDFYPNGRKLRYQSPDEWVPNAAFVNCYAGGSESVGYHSDQLTYLGPRAIIGSLSLGVAREFRVRKIVARDATDAGEEDSSERNSHLSPGRKSDDGRADMEGQIAIHLPHNSLLVMHAEMQEEWKHSISPAASIDPHPLAGNRRLNVTYRCYKPYLHPTYTPRCKCGLPTVLRCVQRKKENRGRYMWMCHANYAPGKEGCRYFEWAEFDDNGEPPWVWEDSRAKSTRIGDGKENQLGRSQADVPKEVEDAPAQALSEPLKSEVS